MLLSLAVCVSCSKPRKEFLEGTPKEAEADTFQTVWASQRFFQTKLWEDAKQNHFCQVLFLSRGGGSHVGCRGESCGFASRDTCRCRCRLCRCRYRKLVESCLIHTYGNFTLAFCLVHSKDSGWWEGCGPVHQTAALGRCFAYQSFLDRINI